jgi:hypothetical protein
MLSLLKKLALYRSTCKHRTQSLRMEQPHPQSHFLSLGLYRASRHSPSIARNKEPKESIAPLKEYLPPQGTRPLTLELGLKRSTQGVHRSSRNSSLSLRHELGLNRCLRDAITTQETRPLSLYMQTSDSVAPDGTTSPSVAFLEPRALSRLTALALNRPQQGTQGVNRSTQGVPPSSRNSSSHARTRTQALHSRLVPQGTRPYRSDMNSDSIAA